jgi:hypothetical protein
MSKENDIGCRREESENVGGRRNNGGEISGSIEMAKTAAREKKSNIENIIMAMASISASMALKIMNNGGAVGVSGSGSVISISIESGGAAGNISLESKSNNRIGF